VSDTSGEQPADGELQPGDFAGFTNSGSGGWALEAIHRAAQTRAAHEEEPGS
jgi:hypothetical protein